MASHGTRAASHAITIMACRPVLSSFAVPALFVTLRPRVARAQSLPAWDTLAGTVVYGAGGSAQTPLLGRVANVLRTASSPIAMVHQDAGGPCTGIYALTGLDST